MQLDIFEHSRDVMLRNDVVQALEHYDATAAQAACERLAQEFPRDVSLPELRILAEAVDFGERQMFSDHEALRRARLALQQTVRPAALGSFGDTGGGVWLSRLWQELAERAAPLAFSPACAGEHAAPLWLQAGDWQAAEQAVTRIESWRRIPAPLGWMVEARLHRVGLQATWPLLAELAWLSPRRLGELVPRSPDPLLPPLMSKFEADFEGAGDDSDIAWFPAWVLTERPDAARHMAPAQASQHGAPEQGMRLLVELLGLEHQGRHHDFVNRRKALRDLQPSLFKAYMRTR